MEKDKIEGASEVSGNPVTIWLVFVICERLALH